MKPWHEKPLWEKVWLCDDKVHLMAGKLIGHLGTEPFTFYDSAKILPN